MIAVGRQGGAVAVVDGPEIRLWSAAGAPLWTRAADAVPTALAVVDDRVWTADASGTATAWWLADGAPASSLAVRRRPVRVLEVAGDVIVAADDEGVAWFEDGRQAGEIAVSGACALALDAAGGRLAVLDARGTLTVVDLAEGRVTGALTAGGMPSGVCWHPRGYWLVSAGGAVRAVQEDGASMTGISVAAAPGSGAPALTASGAAAVVRRSARELAVTGLEGGEPLGALQVSRDCHAVVAGHGGVVWLEVAPGDAVAVDLLTGDVRAGGAHPGRVPSPPAVDVRVDPARLRGLAARLQAGRAPLAVARVVVDAPVRTRRWLWIGAGVVVVAGVVVTLVTLWALGVL